MTDIFSMIWWQLSPHTKRTRVDQRAGRQTVKGQAILTGERNEVELGVALDKFDR